MSVAKGSLIELHICRPHHTADLTRQAARKSFQTLFKFAIKSLQRSYRVFTVAMRQQIKHFYEFGPFRLDVGERILMCEDRVVPLTPKAFETLLALVENSGRIVEKDFLMKKIWPDT